MLASFFPRYASLALALILTASSGAVSGSTDIKSEAVSQIMALLQEKQSRNAAQQKIDSHLLYAVGPDGKSLRPRGSLALGPQIATDEDGLVLVDITAHVSGRLTRRIEAAGGHIVNELPQFDSVRARVPLNTLEGLAEMKDVRTIRPAEQYILQMINVTEGDVAHAADTARTRFGVDGTGTKACAMSDSVEALASLQASGDLPAGVDVLPGQAGTGTSEGTALLEIIFDMAPGADLGFATGQGGQAQMAQNILDLAAVDCSIIVDDILYFAEGVFQDGIIAQAVETVTAGGTMYISSAGNSGRLNAGTSGVWEGDYVGTTLPSPLNGAGLSAHDFGGGSNSNEVTADSPFFFTLQWADPLDGATNDYDLFLLDAALSTVLAASTNTQNGSQDPFEFIDTQADDHTGARLVVVKFSGDDRFIHLNTHRGRLDVGTDGQIFGHPGAVNAMTIAAVNVATAGGGQFTGGPANPVETFSSDGPRRIFFEPDGTPLSISRGPTSEVRQKPDYTAADGVSTATPGFNPFFGTSASAPHAAGIAALFREYLQDAIPSGVSVHRAFDIFKSTALDIEALGFDRDSGNGIIMGEQALDHTIFVDGFESGDTASWTQ